MAETTLSAEERADLLQRWQRRVLITSWITYASFYLGRVNLAVALPALQADFGWARAQVGGIGSAFFWCYALGQLINGTLGDRLNPRAFVTAGLIASAVMNIGFGFSSPLLLLTFFWALNGYVQSTGWGPIMRVLSHWFGAGERGRVTAIFGPCYTAGHVTSWLVGGWLVTRYGWRTAFWVPAALLLFSALHWWSRVRSAPPEAGLPPVVAEVTEAKTSGLGELWRYVVQRPPLQLAALACVALGLVKESFTLWTPTYLIESSGFNVAQAAGYAIWLPLAGALGVALSGWASHRFFRSEEAPVVAVLLAGLAVAVALYRPWVQWLGPAGIPFSLGLIGAMSNGANGLLLTALPMTHIGHDRVSSIAGFLDFASYVGAGLGGLLSGILADRWGWGAAFGLWSVSALLGMAAILALWRRK